MWYYVSSLSYFVLLWQWSSVRYSHSTALPQNGKPKQIEFINLFNTWYIGFMWVSVKEESTEKEKEGRKVEKRYLSSSFATTPIGILTAPTSCFAMVKGLQGVLRVLFSPVSASGLLLGLWIVFHTYISRIYLLFCFQRCLVQFSLW